MKPPSSSSIRAYGRLLWLLRGRDPQEQQAIKDDAELLLDAARARGAGAVAATWLALLWDLVVVGTHGRRGLRRLLLGSVAEATVRHAACSTLVARG